MSAGADNPYAIIVRIKGHDIDFRGLPLGFATISMLILQHQACRPDHALILADGFDKTAESLGTTSIYAERLKAVSVQIRNLATYYPGGSHA